MWLREKGPVFLCRHGSIWKGRPNYSLLWRSYEKIQGVGLIMVQAVIVLVAELHKINGFISQELCDFKPKIVIANRQELGLPQKVGGSGRPTIPRWPHEGVNMQQFFKAVLMAPDRGDAMIPPCRNIRRVS